MTYFLDAEIPPSLPQAMLEAEQAARQGDQPRAYQLSLKAAQNTPENLSAWLLCAETAPSIEAAAACLNQAIALQPFDPTAKQKTYQLVQRLLEQDPFILYLGETEALYHVRSGAHLPLTVPKDRTVPEAYPARRPVRLQQAYRWLWLAFLGLPLAGLGAIIFAPLAAAAAIGLYLQAASKANRIYSLMVIILSGGLWLGGLLLGVILLVHLI